jgi:hypothetical protein
MCADSDKRTRCDVAGNEPYEFYEVWNFWPIKYEVRSEVIFGQGPLFRQMTSCEIARIIIG